MELSNEVWGRGLIPVITLDLDTAGPVVPTEVAGLHCELWPVGVQGVADKLWHVREGGREGVREERGKKEAS